MAWREIYSLNMTTLVAKVPSNSVYYDNTACLANLYDRVRNDKPTDGVPFGGGWLSYKNEAGFECLKITVYNKSGLFDIGNASVEVHMDYDKKSRVYQYYVKLSLCNDGANDYVREHMDFCDEQKPKTVHVSDLNGDLWEFIKGLLMTVQNAYQEYYKIYKNELLAFNIDNMESIGELKDFVEKLGYRIEVTEDKTDGNIICIHDDADLTFVSSDISFVTMPVCHIWKTNGYFDRIYEILGYKPSYSSRNAYRFKDPKDMFEFIKKFISCYKEVQDRTTAAKQELRQYLQ